MVFSQRNSDAPAPDGDRQPQSFEGLLSDEDRQKLQEMVDPTPEPTADSTAHPAQPDVTPGETLPGPKPDDQSSTPLIPPIDPDTPMYPGACQPASPEAEADLFATEDSPPDDVVLATIEQTQQKTDSLSRDLNDLMAERDELTGRLLELETIAEEAQQLIGQAQLETEQRTQALQESRDELETQVEMLQGQLSRRQERLMEFETQMNDATERLDASTTQIDEIRREIDGLQSTLEDREETIAQFESTQEASRTETEGLHHQLKNSAELQEEHQHRIEALTCQLDVARNAARELEKQANQLRDTANRHDAERAALQTQHDADQEAADAARARHEQDLSRQSEHAATLQSKLDENATTLRQRDESIEQLERRRDELQREYESERTRAGEQARQLTSELDAATTQGSEYKTELEQLWSLRDTLSGIERERDDAQASAREAIESVETQQQTLETTREHLHGVALHLDRRKRRLSGLDSMLHDRSDSIVKERLQDGHERIVDEQRKIHNERERMSNLHQTLVTSEQKMLRLWAPQKASVVMSTLVIAIALLGTGSWFLTGWLFPPVVAASFTIMPQTKSAAPLSTEQLDKWRTMHAEMPGDTAFRLTLLRRVQDRQIPIEELDLDAHLDEHLTIDAAQADRITYTLSGTNRHETLAVLDVLASSLITESIRNLERRSDGAYAVATNEQREGSVSRYASFNPLPVEDQRLLWLGPVFATLAALAGLIFAFGLRQFRGIKRVINSNTILADANDKHTP